jgi:cell division protein ZapA (FtsZ GTPase activity inhibitor)
MPNDNINDYIPARHRPPEAESLAPSALKLSRSVMDTIDKSVMYGVNVLDGLIKEIEKIKAEIIEDGARLKQSVEHHFQLQAEAHDLRERVKRKLTELPKVADNVPTEDEKG